MASIFEDIGNFIKDPTRPIRDLGRGLKEDFGKGKELLRQSQDVTKRLQIGGERRALLEAVQKDETISEITRQELMGGILGTPESSLNKQPLTDIRKTFEEAQQAKEGSKFANRQRTQLLWETIGDRPGIRRQTQVSNSTRSLLEV